MALNPEVWGPKYWFVLHTIAMCYPHSINEVTKKKYYDFIQNLPIFLPDEEIGNKFSQMLDKYPVSPYLDSRKSFIKWMHFIHNKVNETIGKEEISIDESMKHYYDNYKPLAKITIEDKKRREKYLLLGFVVSSIIIATMLYKKGKK